MMKVFKSIVLITKLGISAVVLSTLPVANAFSQESQNDPLAAHEHGHGELMLAQDGQDLLVELHLPGANVVGFEHAPENHEQEHAVEIAKESLKDTSRWLHLTEAAECKIEDAHVSSPFTSEHEDEHELEDDHEDEHTGETHAEFTAEFHIHCAAPDNLKSINIDLFKILPSLEKIEYQAVISSGQYGGELIVNQTSIQF